MHDKAKRSAGELVFNFILFSISLILLWQAYLISGFESLSSPGALPMAVAFAMVVSSGLILLAHFREPADEQSSFLRDILPPVVIVMMLMIAGYAVLLVPLGFLPTSLLFLILSILYLRRGGLGFAVIVSLCSLICIYIIFRLVFTVLMPAGIVPEGEILGAIGNMFGGAE
ncbi:tripartite tricarboxylate transporter TctB family protein [Paracoccus aerodenitrificans]|uniref:tripartite tricarboxylate transporter TctB family protein n=1 Tax=Paracoccus aerodenitrificans TaxID=3017781 RepID=UPI0022F0CE84|nr:tripartite tricarboxylate transporter TctB family protein [Paracoccus aerodenitrificans]WBU63776.1 tripartite tricarboxylate transporter TctB family protein [Paracoccus aerodenitrificans]